LYYSELSDILAKQVRAAKDAVKLAVRQEELAALLKQVYLKYLLIHKRWQKKCVRDWDIAAGQLKLIFVERMKNE